MPNLVGIGNSQVPTNAMLGGLAYQDSVGEIDIDKIKARTSDTAVDVFVYDTRKDSDGGAWRHRTQNKSWYNEAASATRGARKEFPAVAVLVLKADDFIIYDGDDPNLPMWMVFKKAGNSYFSITTNSCVAALNGKIASGGNASNDRFRVIDFLLDNEREYSHSDGQHTHLNPISGRNETVGFTPYDSSLPGLVNRYINGVAMTVLPNAPIDASTGLPVPTIAVTTNDGTDIINDNGTIESYSDRATEHVDIHPDGFMIDGVTGAVNDNFSLFNISDTARVIAYGHRTIQPINTFLNQATGECLFEGKSNKIAIAQTLGLLRIEENLSDYATGLHNKTASSYNTGWMPAYAKGAFLSDTDSTNVTGETIDLTNGEAATGQEGNFSSIAANSIVAGTTSDSIARYNTGTDGSVLVSGKQYLATLTISNYSGSGDLGVASGAGFDGTFRFSANGTYYKHITYNNGEVQLFYRNTNTATIGISLKEVDVDRTVINKGLAMHGTISRSPVATGAELVSYNSLTSSNYLEQPYNSDLNFGTGDFCMIGWFYNVGTSASILYRLHNSTTVGKGYIVATSSGGELGYSSYTQGFRSTGRITHYTTDTWNGQQRWNMFVCGKKGGYGFTYVNGILKQTAINANSHSDTTYKPPLRIGNNHAGNGGIGGGKLALIRISSTFPSEKQIKKMYNDEKCLFHKNAKCTFYGTSNDVKALAYDDTTNVLHVGTSSGRSEFQGLNRINNTTTAVTTAISASDGLVAEQ